MRGDPELELRPTDRTEIGAVCEVHRRAFDGREEEPRLVRMLHAAGKAPISLVALLGGKIVGHVLFSPMPLDPPEPGIDIVGLAPVAVLPEHQGKGVGSRLIREGLLACREAGYAAVVVLGDPGFYCRFGFGRASRHRLANEYGVDDPFMVVELRQGALGDARVVGYQPEFGESGV